MEKLTKSTRHNGSLSKKTSFYQ